MVFSSQLFLFFFLPIVFIGYLICRRLQSKNLWLLFVSLFFYAYGAGKIVLILLFSAVSNWGIALLITKAKTRHIKRLLLVIDILTNISYLFYYKYFNFAMQNLHSIMGNSSEIVEITLPIGISFFTFQALSYCIDVYRNESLAEKSIVNVALYITFFPQLIAGPIVRFSTIVSEIHERCMSPKDFKDGVVRFSYGLGKKVLIANVIATMVDSIYSMSPSEISVSTAWLVSIGYTFQIFFDFSGYSDMAIGLGRMFGFHFEENFNYPYISKSITEFWRRWHISLSRWFRDYIYIPLGGNRKSLKRQILNLAIVWICTGVWHGANWTFIFWGIIYGVFVILEKLLRFDERNVPAIISHIYTLIVVNFLWVLFRAENIQAAVAHIKVMMGIGANPLWDDTAAFYLLENYTVLILAIIVSIPIIKTLNQKPKFSRVFTAIRPFFVLLVLLLCIAYMVKGSYNPFIYFNF